MSPHGSKCVLVVEDCRDVRETIAEVLVGAGFETVTAANGQEALDYLRGAGTRPGLILLDLMMPVMDGWQFRIEQEKIPDIADISVVVMSAVDDGRRKAASIRPVEFVAKPIEIDKLLEVASRHCKVA
jgi:CheY-like chemotaxis protein